MSAIDVLYVPQLAPAQKHPTVFQKFDALKKGESFILVNDHDPIPLYYEMKAERGDVFEWNKLENGPETWRVKIVKTVDEVLDVPAAIEEKAAATGDTPVLNVTLLEPRQKHPTIFRCFDALEAGKAFQILNDHDPKPLYYQLLAERGKTFSWQYLESGPKWWRVEIGKLDTANGETVGEIAAADIRKAEVFKKYGIDFCCGGKKSLKQACEEAKVDVATVEAELAGAAQKEAKGTNLEFNRWDADFLADYIYNQHHAYYYEEGPIIGDLAHKVANHHGQYVPALQQVYLLYRTLQDELNVHFQKEERVLFPFIKALAKAKRTGDRSDLNTLASIAQPVRVMEMDHDAAGEILTQIRHLTNDYTAPAGSCNSVQLLFYKLANLEADLHQHIHLENNILFPKALKLEKELSA